MRKLGVLGAAVGAVAVLASGCGGGTSSSSGPTSTAPTSAPTNGSGQVSTAPPGATTVAVKMTDFHLALPTQSFAPGTYSFVAANDGRTVHSLEIVGPGVADQRIPGVVAAGQSATLTVTLQPGSYEVYCPVGDHKAMGMDTHITVRGATATPNAPTSTPNAPTSTSVSGGGY